MPYRVERDGSGREPFGEYRYRIYDGDMLIANYWHDFRGDEHGIDFAVPVSGSPKDLWPVGRMIDFLEGGGPEPHALSERALAYIKAKLEPR